MQLPTGDRFDYGLPGYLESGVVNLLNALKVPNLSADGTTAVSVDGNPLPLGMTRPNTAVTLGDSITARDWAVAGSTPTLTGVVGGYTATLALTAHKLFVGDSFKVCNSADVAYNGNFTVLSRVDANTITYTTAIAITSASPAGTAELRYPTSLANNGYFTWANGLSGGRMTLLSNGGNSGERLATMLARVDRDVIALHPAVCVFLGGTNDIRGNDTPDADALFLAWKAIVDRLIGAGIDVEAGTIMSYATGDVNITTAKIGAMNRLNKLIRDYCQITVGVNLNDFNAAFADPAATDGRALTAYFEDTVHQSPRGAYVMGKILAASFSKRKAWSSLPGTPADAFSFDTAALCDNPLLQVGTGGTLTGVSGTAATDSPQSWKMEGTSGGTLAGSLVARTVAADGDTYGNNARFLATFSANNDYAQLRQNSLTARVAAGDYVYAECSVRFVAVPSTFKRAFLAVNFTADGVSYSATTGLGTTSNTMPNEDMTLTLRTPPIRIPVNLASLTVLEALMFTQVSGAATAMEMIVGRMQLRKVLD